MDYSHHPRKGDVGIDDVKREDLNINTLCKMTHDCIFRAVIGFMD